MENLKFLKDAADAFGLELRFIFEPLKINESVVFVLRPFDFSEKIGGTLDGFKFYSSHYLYPKKTPAVNCSKKCKKS